MAQKHSQMEKRIAVLTQLAKAEMKEKEVKVAKKQIELHNNISESTTIKDQIMRR